MGSRWTRPRDVVHSTRRSRRASSNTQGRDVTRSSPSRRGRSQGQEGARDGPRSISTRRGSQGVERSACEARKAAKGAEPKEGDPDPTAKVRSERYLEVPEAPAARSGHARQGVMDTKTKKGAAKMGFFFRSCSPGSAL